MWKHAKSTKTGEIVSWGNSLPLYQSRETQAMPEPPGNVSEEILFEVCKSTKPFHLPTAIAVLTEEHCWTTCLICEQS